MEKEDNKNYGSVTIVTLITLASDHYKKAGRNLLIIVQF